MQLDVEAWCDLERSLRLAGGELYCKHIRKGWGLVMAIGKQPNYKPFQELLGQTQISDDGDSCAATGS